MATNQVSKLSRCQVYKIATGYATSGQDYSAHYFAEQYGITENVFYSVLKRAVVESIVDAETVQKIAAKSAKNSEEHGGEGGAVRSEKNYKHYMLLRQNFSFTKQDRIRYAEGYAHSYKNVAEYCREVYIAERKLLEKTLRSAIVDNLIKDDVVEMLRSKAISLNGERAKAYFDGLIEERKRKIAEAKDMRRRARKNVKSQD